MKLTEVVKCIRSARKCSKIKIFEDGTRCGQVTTVNVENKQASLEFDKRLVSVTGLRWTRHVLVVCRGQV